MSIDLVDGVEQFHSLLPSHRSRATFLGLSIVEVKIETMHLTLAARLIWVIAGLKGERRSRRSLTRDPEARPIQPFGPRENVMANSRCSAAGGIVRDKPLHADESYQRSSFLTSWSSLQRRTSSMNLRLLMQLPQRDGTA